MKHSRLTVQWQVGKIWSNHRVGSAKGGDSQFQSETRRRISKAEEKDKRERRQTCYKAKKPSMKVA